MIIPLTVPIVPVKSDINSGRAMDDHSLDVEIFFFFSLQGSLEILQINECVCTVYMFLSVVLIMLATHRVSDAVCPFRLT